MTATLLGVDASAGSASSCTLAPGRTIALIHVERDTMLPHAAAGLQPMSGSSVRPGPGDSSIAMPGTLMPAARVRLLEVDSATRLVLSQSGVNGSQPTAFVRAAPYRADCRVIRWMASSAWVQPGDTGFVRASLAPPELWIDGTPVLVIPEVWSYPYPRARGLAYGVARDERLAPAAALYSITAALEALDRNAADARRQRALDWARVNLADADLEPVRRTLREAVLQPDWRDAEKRPSRLRGSYRVTVESDGVNGSWFFRTHERPGYNWRIEPLRSAAELIASPHVEGYKLVGLAAPTPEQLATQAGLPISVQSLVWLSARDRPTAPGNVDRRMLSGELEFLLKAAPESLWTALEAFVPPMTPMDSAFFARSGRTLPRSSYQPRFPITLVIDDTGGVRADTTVTAKGRRLRIRLERVDTFSVKRPF